MRSRAWLLFLGVSVVLGAAGEWSALLGWLALWASLYGWSLWRKPRLPCWRCRGSGISGHRILPWKGFGDCPSCHGKKSFVRLGVRVFQPDRARQLNR